MEKVKETLQNQRFAPTIILAAIVGLAELCLCSYWVRIFQMYSEELGSAGGVNDAVCQISMMYRGIDLICSLCIIFSVLCLILKKNKLAAYGSVAAGVLSCVYVERRSANSILLPDGVSIGERVVFLVGTSTAMLLATVSFVFVVLAVTKGDPKHCKAAIKTGVAGAVCGLVDCFEWLPWAASVLSLRNYVLSRLQSALREGTVLLLLLLVIAWCLFMKAALAPKKEKPKVAAAAPQGGNSDAPKTMFCSHCGKEVDACAVVCPYCGCQVGQIKGGADDVPSTGLNVLGFLFPLIGLILYLVFKDSTPVRAKEIGIWALRGFIVGAALGVVGTFLVYFAF